MGSFQKEYQNGENPSISFFQAALGIPQLLVSIEKGATLASSLLIPYVGGDMAWYIIEYLKTEMDKKKKKIKTE